MTIGTYSMEIYLIFESVYNHSTAVFHNDLEKTGLVYTLTVFTATLVLAVLLRMVSDQLTRVFDAQSGAATQKKEGEAA